MKTKQFVFKWVVIVFLWPVIVAGFLYKFFSMTFKMGVLLAKKLGYYIEK